MDFEMYSQQLLEALIAKSKRFDEIREKVLVIDKLLDDYQVSGVLLDDEIKSLKHLI
jgi:hypothetical protein